jgi:hypothetical protein
VLWANTGITIAFDDTIATTAAAITATTIDVILFVFIVLLL